MNKENNITSILNNASCLTDIFNFYVKKYPNQKFLFKKTSNQWVGENYLDISLRVNKIANAFIKLGVKKKDRVFLLSSNRIEWVEFDLAIMSLGAITVPSFVTNNKYDNQFIIKDCKPKVLILENHKVYDKNKSFLKKFTNKIILIDNESNFLNYKKILFEFGTTFKRIPLKKNDTSTIIYTSGTSGNPKGVVLSHKALLHNLNAALHLIKEFGIKSERFISFLPLSHSYERMAGLYFPLLIGAQIFFSSSLDKLLIEIKEVKPTFFSAVPRLYENIYKKIKAQINNSGKIKRMILKIIFNSVEDKNINIFSSILGKIFIKLFIFKKIKNNLGGKIKVLVSGGAALSPQIGFFFNKVGFDLLQGYGQTEAAPLISCNTKKNNDPKTVGFPVKNVVVKISDEDEILVKGDNVMNGYWNNKKLTKETVKNNWLHTGDLGYYDELGRLVINGRKKDIIVTSGGDNISVQKIESILSEQFEINQAIIYGDGKPYIIALLSIEKGFKKEDINMCIKSINEKLNSVEKIRKFLLLEKPLSYDDGFLTQTQKVKRNKVHSYFKDKIEKLYS